MAVLAILPAMPIRRRGRPLKIAATPRYPNRVRVLRERRGLSQLQLGEAAHMDNSTVGKIERGELRLKVEQMLALARGLRVDIRDLLDDAARNNVAVIGRLLRHGGVATAPTPRRIECPTALDATATLAIEVQENALFPLPNGGVILFDRLSGIAPDAIGRLAVVRQHAAAPLLVGQLRACPSPDIYTLWSSSGPVLEEVTIEAASPVRAWLEHALVWDVVPDTDTPEDFAQQASEYRQAAETPQRFRHRPQGRRNS